MNIDHHRSRKRGDTLLIKCEHIERDVTFNMFTSYQKGFSSFFFSVKMKNVYCYLRLRCNFLVTRPA